MTTYRVWSVKGSQMIDGTLEDAIAAAVAHEEEHQPAFGVEVEDDDGEVVARVSDGQIERAATPEVTTYCVEIEGGLGDTEVTAPDLATAWKMAVKWARGGDWGWEDDPAGAHDIRASVRVWREDDDGGVIEEREQTVVVCAAEDHPASALAPDCDGDGDDEGGAEHEWGDVQSSSLGGMAWSRVATCRR